MNNLSRIWSIFGVLMSANAPTTSQYRVQYARILVAMMFQSLFLIKEVLVEDEDERVFNQAFYAEWVPHSVLNFNQWGTFAWLLNMYSPSKMGKLCRRGSRLCTMILIRLH